MALKHSLGWSNGLIDQLHTKIVERLTTGFGEVVQVDAHPAPGEALGLPAALVEVEGFTPSAEQPGGDADAFETDLAVRLVIDPNMNGAAIFLRQTAAEMAMSLRRLGRPIPNQGHLRLVRVGDDEFQPQFDGYLVWKIECRIKLIFACPEPEGQTPELWLGMAPEIGETDPAHIVDYTLAE